MKRAIVLVAIIVFGAAGPAYAIYSVSDKGDWPTTWPKELEPLRTQSRTLVGPMAPHRHYAIRFTKREEIEAAWPHILKVKSKGTPIFLVHSSNFFLGENVKAGVVVHCPPVGQADNPATPEAPIAGLTDAGGRWMNTTYIELVVDGDIVDLNRIALPADTPIVDQRFKDEKKK